MRRNYPGLTQERLPSGQWRLRVRVKGRPSQRITLSVPFEHPEFHHAYAAARQGQAYDPQIPATAPTIRKSLGWLASLHLAWLAEQVEAGRYSNKTLASRRRSLKALTDRYAAKSLAMPPYILRRMEDRMAETPSAFAKLVRDVSAMFALGIERGYCQANPAEGFKPRNRQRGPRGATPCTPEEVRQYLRHHPPGTSPHLAMMILLFTACRVGDAATLGRQHETTREGRVWLSWQPGKAGSARMSLPMAAPLYDATRAATVIGETYLLTSQGKPFSSGGLSSMVKRWFRQAGIDGRSAHSVRKMVAEMIAGAGLSQYAAMAMLAHSEARTSEIYTKQIDRAGLSSQGVAVIEALNFR